MAQPPRPEDFGAVPVSSAGPRPEDFGGARVDSPAASPAPVTGTSEGGGLLSYMASPRAPAEAIATLGTGMVGQAVGGIAGLAAAALPGEAGQGARVAERVSSALTYEPRTKAGSALVSAAQVPGELFSKHIAKPLGERGARVSPALGAVGETAAEAVPILLGARAATKPGKPLTSDQQRVADARDQGFKMTPEEMGAGPVARGAAGLAGEPRLARALSNENADVALGKAKAELGMRPDAPLDIDTLSLMRKNEGKKYDVARGAGQVTMDTTYQAGVDKLAAKYKSAAEEFPGAQKLDQLAIREIDDVISMLKKEDPAIAAARAQGIKLPQGALGPQTFSAGGAVNMIGALREGADGAFRSGKGSLGKVMRGGAEALELQLERHLKATGQEAILADFQAARTQIAKTYAVEKALLGEDRVNMQKFGQQVRDHKPLTGGLKESGEFARDFDRSSQKPTNMPSGAAFGDLALAALRNIGGPRSLGADLITLGARPAVRSVLESRPGQWAMDPRTNLSGPAMEAIGASTAVTPRKEKR